LRIRHDLRVIEEPKKPVRDFVDFADYRSFLEENVSAIHNNANDKNRMIKYRAIASISSGYDSSASAVLASTVGCKDALTFSHARLEYGDTEDSGSQIGAILGMNYDKPIARRLVEEAGVERGLFGTKKKAVAIVPRMEGGVSAVMTKESFVDFERFSHENWNSRMAIRAWLFRWLHQLYNSHSAPKIVADR
jgi:hypothetical protein